MSEHRLGRVSVKVGLHVPPAAAGPCCTFAEEIRYMALVIFSVCSYAAASGSGSPLCLPCGAHLLFIALPAWSRICSAAPAWDKLRPSRRSRPSARRLFPLQQADKVRQAPRGAPGPAPPAHRPAGFVGGGVQDHRLAADTDMGWCSGAGFSSSISRLPWSRALLGGRVQIGAELGEDLQLTVTGPGRCAGCRRFS